MVHLIPLIVLAIFCSLIVVYILLRTRDRAITRGITSFYKGRVVWITGGSSGIGLATAQHLINLGAHVILTARRRNDADLVVPAGCPRPEWVEADLSTVATSESAAQTIIDRVKAASPTGRIHDVFHIAGISVRAEAIETEPHVVRSVFDINTFAPIILTQLLMTPKANQTVLMPNGRIVIASSVQGHLPLPFRAPYAASKHAIQAYFDSLRLELQLGPRNVRSNRVWEQHHTTTAVYSPPAVVTVCFGYVNTSLSRNALTGSGALYNQMDETTRLGISPLKAASILLRAAYTRHEEVWAAPMAHRLAMMLWSLLPGLVKNSIRSRALRQLRIDDRNRE